MIVVESIESLVNAMTIDVEDYFQVQAFASCVGRDSWNDFASHVEENTTRILAQFDRNNIHATFFTLGWVAERYPSIVRQIVAGGHELASHGYGHELVHSLTPEQFRNDVLRARNILEDIGGVSVQGYRAPTFSVGSANAWAFRVLDETGHTYSSSVYPVHHDLYGDPGAPRFAHRPAGCSLIEIPMTTFRFGGHNFPIAGGGYFRLLPYYFYRAALRRFGEIEKMSSVFYLHPWEIDTKQPRIVGASRRSNFRHHVNIGAVSNRLERLLQDFRWNRVDHVFASELALAQGRVS